MSKNIKNDGFKPCHFCGSERIYASKARKGIYRVECWCCGASVDSVASIDKAIKWWNTRVAEVEPDCLAHKKPEPADSLARIAGEIKGAEAWCDQNGRYDTGLVSISEPKLREWADRIRRLAEKEDEHED